MLNIDYKPILPGKKLPIVIIGASGIVKDAHLPAYQKAGYYVHGIVNRTRSKAEALAAEYGIPNVYNSIAEAVAQAPADTVYDITIMPDQFVETLSQLPDGAAVLIQKPMGDYREQTQAIYDVCRDKKLVAAVNCQLRQAPFIKAARWLIDQGHIGEVYDMEVRVTVQTPWHLFPIIKEHPRLEILYHSVHYIDLIRSFLGNPEGIYAKTFKHPQKATSSSRTTLLFDYGDTLRAVVNTNHDHDFGAEHQESFVKWEGTKGAIKAKMGLLMNYPDGVPDDFQYAVQDEAGNYSWYRVPIAGSWFPDAFIESMGSLMRYKLGEIDGLPASVQDVLHTMDVVEAAYRSSERGGLQIDYRNP